MAKRRDSALKGLARDLCPPLAWRALQAIKAKVSPPRGFERSHPDSQDLDVYWDDEMAELLETWGDGNVWNEIQYLLYEKRGRVLDIACGTGKTMSVLSRYPGLELHGFDISDMLINKALERGIARDRVRVADATKLDYADASFEYSYSIGSFEHFTEEGLDMAIAESARVSSRAAFHMVPVARSGRDEGWMKTYQSFFNNSVPWWTALYARHFSRVIVLDSAWNDSLSVGCWFVCLKDPAP